ncbi:unnamed protein product [Sphagnum compactum]
MAMQNCSFLISVLVLILIAILALNEQPVNSHLQAAAPGIVSLRFDDGASLDLHMIIPEIQVTAVLQPDPKKLEKKITTGGYILYLVHCNSDEVMGSSVGPFPVASVNRQQYRRQASGAPLQLHSRKLLIMMQKEATASVLRKVEIAGFNHQWRPGSSSGNRLSGVTGDRGRHRRREAEELRRQHRSRKLMQQAADDVVAKDLQGCSYNMTRDDCTARRGGSAGGQAVQPGGDLETIRDIAPASALLQGKEEEEEDQTSGRRWSPRQILEHYSLPRRRRVVAMKLFSSDRMVPTGPNPVHNSNRSDVIP